MDEKLKLAADKIEIMENAGITIAKSPGELDIKTLKNWENN